MALSAYGLMKFPEKLEKEIGLSGKSQSALSRETGVGQSAISAMTRGDRRPFMDQAFKIARALGVPLDYLADDEVDEIPSPEITDDDRAILDLFHALRISKQEALRRLAGVVVVPGNHDVERPAFDPANPWVGPQRDTTERYLREKSEERMPKPAPRARPKGMEPRERGGGKGATERGGEERKGSESKN